MSKACLLSLCLLFLGGLATLQAQRSYVYPVVKGYGGIYAIPEATVLPDPMIPYKMVVDVASGSQHPDSLSVGFHRVARMLNLMAVGGVPADQLEVVLAIHANATYGIMEDEAYQQKYGTNNPNLGIIKALKEAGVRLTVCGQSLIAREVPFKSVTPEVEVATSMLTTVAMYQMQGYGLIKF